MPSSSRSSRIQLFPPQTCRFVSTKGARRQACTSPRQTWIVMDTLRAAHDVWTHTWVIHLQPPNHWEECRRRVYQSMYHYEGPKIPKWLHEHASDPRKVGASIWLTPTPGSASSSTAPAPAVDEAPAPPPPRAPGDVHGLEGLNADDFANVASLLVGHGVPDVDAQRFVCSIMEASQSSEPRTAAGFFEVYGQGGPTRAARRYKGLNVHGLQVMDLRALRADGEHWDFTRIKDRRWAIRLVREQKPLWSIAAPPCASFTHLNAVINYPRMDHAEVSRRIQEGMLHLRCVCKLHHHQPKHNRFFLHEHPLSARSWKTEPVQDILRDPQVMVTKCNQCRYGGQRLSPPTVPWLPS